MIRLIADTFGWTMDADGTMLTVRTPKARQIIDQLRHGKQYAVEIRRYTKKRSLDQNAMYWATLNEVAAAMKISVPYCHNLMLRRYGKPYIVEGKYLGIKIRDTDEAAKQIDEDEETHLYPTSKVFVDQKDGLTYRWYFLLRGSSQLQKDEFCELMDGLLDEAKQMGIVPIWEE